MCHGVCPWWAGYFLINPLRRIAHNPEKILTPYIKEGASLMDIGCGMGYFTLPMARLTGNKGHVVAIDLQPKMINALLNRTAKAGLTNIIEARVCSAGSLNIGDYSGKIDFVLAFAVVHEVPDQNRFLSEIISALRPTGKLLIAEPSFHVSKEKFANTIELAQAMGFVLVNYPQITRSMAGLLVRSD